MVKKTKKTGAIVVFFSSYFCFFIAIFANRDKKIIINSSEIITENASAKNIKYDWNFFKV